MIQAGRREVKRLLDALVFSLAIRAQETPGGLTSTERERCIDAMR
jgi:hypothetical protein